MLRKIARRAGILLAVLVAVVAALALYVDIDGIPRATPIDPGLRVEITPARVERGGLLAGMLCADCHQEGPDKPLTGRRLVDMPKEFGEVWSKNITQHPEHGIGRWTDGELAYFLRTGVRRDGQYVPPWMPKFPHLSDEDLASVIAFLRSSDPLVAASDRVPEGVTKPSLLSKALAHGVFGPLPYPTQPMIAPDRSDRVAYGRYLTFALDCFSCHSADFKTMNVMEPEKSGGYLGGGNAMIDGDGKTIFVPNITSDEETGIGRWSDAEFLRAVKQGVRPDGRVLHAPMAPRSLLADDDVAAIHAYLRTVPKIRNAVPRPRVAVAAAGDARGKDLYAKYGCAACHGEKGTGAIGDLRAANERYASDADLRRWLDEAPTLKPGTRMPGFKGLIAEDDYAPLVRHVRSLARPAKEAAR